MADEKKPKKFDDKKGDKKEEKKPAPSPFAFLANADHIDLVLLLIVLMGMSGAASLGYYFFLRGYGLILRMTEIFQYYLPFLKMLSLVITLLLGTGIVYLTIKINKITDDHKKTLYADGKIPDVLSAETPIEKEKNGRWEKIERHMQTENPGDWKLAILEADILLGDMLENMGYYGESIGEMLKNVEKSDFNSLDEAWEAHKIRNSIAHEGSDFLINRREAERVIGLYHKVFKEFEII